MRMFKGQLLILLIIYVSESSCVIDALYDAGKKVWELYATLDKSNLSCPFDPRTVEELFGDDYRANENITNQMYEIDIILREIEDSINPGINNSLVKIMRPSVNVLKCLDVMDIFIGNIADNYKKFHRIIIQDGYIHDRSLDDLMTSVFPAVESNIGMIRKIMTDSNKLLPDESSLIAAISGYVETRQERICNIYQSIDEILVYLFKRAIIAEIRTILMWPFSNLRYAAGNKEWKNMNDFGKTRFHSYFGSYVSIMQRELNRIGGQYIRACDPTNGAWMLDENCYEFSGMTQEIIFRYQPKACSYQFCRNMWQKRATHCDAKYYDERSGCSSTPINCQNLGAIQACVLKTGPRKFQYVNSSILGFYGDNSKCPEDNGYIIDIGKGSDSSYATCNCQCDGNHNKISLVIMDSTNDYHTGVIIGLRFKLRNNILHIQPRIGKLRANGCIQKYSERWLRIPNDPDASQIHPIDIENSSFFLDDILLPPKFVLTGVRFKKVARGGVTGFAIDIFGVPFDYRSGQLDLEGRIQLSSSNSNLGRSLLFYPVSSLQTKRYNTPSPPDRKYIQLTQSLLISDFGQSIVPLFDAVPVTTDPPSALSGIGIFHKGADGFAGFISLRIYGISYKEYFNNFTSTHTIDGRMQLFT